MEKFFWGEQESEQWVEKDKENRGIALAYDGWEYAYTIATEALPNGLPFYQAKAVVARIKKSFILDYYLNFIDEPFVCITCAKVYKMKDLYYHMAEHVSYRYHMSYQDRDGKIWCFDPVLLKALVYGYPVFK